MITDAQAVNTMASALADRGIAVPAESAAAAPGTTGEALAPATQPPTVDEQIAAIEAPQTGMQEVPEMAAAFFDKAVTPAAYDFGKAPPGVEAMPLETQGLIRDFFAAEQIPAGVGSHIAAEWNRALSAPPSPEAIKQSESNVRGELARTHGSRANALIDAARGEVARMAQSAPWILQALAETGLGNSRVLIEFLGNRATVRESRGKR